MAPDRGAAILAVAALLAVSCQDDEPSMPDPVAETRAAILEAAEQEDYDRLPPLMNRDKLANWRRQGPGPLRLMSVVLRMSPQIRETNEGTLYQWPRLGPNSDPGDMSDEERELFSEVLPEAEVESLILPEYGYTAPRLGILADGRWWFFVIDRAP